jgi:cob(I)alamin adenosyltransferase
MRIYTKTGDYGETSLFGGKRVPKNHLRIRAYGAIDELNSLLGVVLSKLSDERVEESINQIQKDLLVIGSHLAGSRISIENLQGRVTEMEKVIDKLERELPSLSNFILPEGTERATLIFYARSVGRRAERELVTLSKEEAVDEKIHTYLNRLSDFLFVLARYLNYKSGIKETIWKVTS